MDLGLAGPCVSERRRLVVRISRRNNMLRRELRYAEIALLELLRGEWESVVEGGWDALVSATARAIDEYRVRLDAVTRAVEGDRRSLPSLRSSKPGQV